MFFKIVKTKPNNNIAFLLQLSLLANLNGLLKREQNNRVFFVSVWYRFLTI